MKMKLLKERTARILAFVMILMSMAEPLSGSFIYAAEIPEAAEPEAAGALAEASPESLEAAGDGETHVVWFYDKNGNKSVSQNVAHGETIPRPSSPADNAESGGKRFKWWYDYAEGSSTKFDFDTPIDRDYNLYQHWVNIHRIQFHTDGGSQVEDQIVEEGKTAVRPESVSKDGYRLDDWFQEAECQNKYIFSTPVTGDTQIYAGWIKQWTFTFNPNNGTIDREDLRIQVLDEGEAATDPSPYTRRAGADLDGWFTSKNKGSGVKWDFSTLANRDMELFAQWTWQKRTISFDSTLPGYVYPSQTVDYGTQITEPSPAPQKLGFRFAGWYDGEKKWDFSNDKARENITLKARFEEVNYTVRFHSNQPGATTVPNGSVSLGGIIEKPAQIPEHEVYLFTGWYADAAATIPWDFNKTVSEDDAKDGFIDLYGGWKAKTYTVSFNTGDGMPVLPAQVVTHGAYLTQPVIDPPGYLLEGWYEDPDRKKPFSFDTAIKKDYTLYAKWLDAKTVSFNSRGGSIIASMKVVSGNKLVEKNMPASSREGYDFKGWCGDPEASVLWNYDTRIENDTTLYAKWQVRQYKAVFKNGTTVVETKQGIDYGAYVPVTTRTVTKEGYVLKGWFKDEACTEEWDFAADTMPARDLTLYAGWKIISYTISFNKMAAPATVTPTEQTIDHNELLPMPSASYPGYTLDGWYKEPSFSLAGKWNFATDRVKANLWLYARWVIATYTIRFETNGGSTLANQTVSHNGKVRVPEAPTKVGYEFDKWYADQALSTPYDFDTPVTESKTLYAGWKSTPPLRVRAYVSGNHGSITPNGNVSVQKGGSQSFTITPDSGCEVEHLWLDGVEVQLTGNRFVLENVTENHTLVVSFREIPVVYYFISANCGDAHGYMEPSGRVRVREGETKTFSFGALNGYELDYLEVDGKRVLISGNRYTFSDIRADHTITAYFKEHKIDPVIPVGYVQVKFMVDDSLYDSVTLLKGAVLSKPADPVKPGLVFRGWYEGNWKWNFSDPVTKSMTLTAGFLSGTVSPGDVHSGLDPLMNISDPENIIMVKGQSYDFGSGEWASSDSKILSVGKSSGRAKAKNPSRVPVTLTNTAAIPAMVYKVQVLSPEISAKKLNLGVGSRGSLKLLYADGLNLAWISSKPNVVSVEEGEVYAKCKGKAKITAYANGKGYSCTVTVSDKYTAPSSFDEVDAITVRPAQTINLQKVAVNGTRPNTLDWRLTDELNTRDKDKSGWLAWDDGIIRVNVKGVLKAKACGSSVVIGKMGDARIKTIRVNVSAIPAKAETYINVGRNEKLSYYKVANAKADWDATGLGTIIQLGTGNQKGRVYGLSAGSSVVTCAYNGMVYHTTVHVENPAISLNDERIGRVKENEYMLRLRRGTRYMLEMPDVVQQVVWKSKNKKIAFVDEYGIVEARKLGDTTVSTKINGTTVKVRVYVTG